MNISRKRLTWIGVADILPWRGGLRMNSPKVLIAMSGGVDSAVAAHQIQVLGYSCIGATMQLYFNPNKTTTDIADAKAVADRLAIPFHVLNFQQEFCSHVIEPFIRSYETGTTPNPCIQCNRYLKFDQLLRKAMDLGCDYIATGHYARICYEETSGRYLLKKAADPSKDQSYVLYSLTQEQLKHTLLPLGELTKDQVRAIAQENGFVNAHKQDSQDICFVPDGDYAAFMERYTGKAYPKGDFLNQNGDVVGQHNGAIRYTLGQRKGLGLAMGAPMYVCDKNMENNTVTVGPNEALYATSLLANDWNWFPFPALELPMEVMARARYNQKEQPATVYPEENGAARVVFHNPQRALTPGQAVVLYQGNLVIGGGTITSVIAD